MITRGTGKVMPAQGHPRGDLVPKLSEAHAQSPGQLEASESSMILPPVLHTAHGLPCQAVAPARWKKKKTFPSPQQSHAYGPTVACMLPGLVACTWERGFSAELVAAPSNRPPPDLTSAAAARSVV